MSAKISAIVPTYNRARMLPEAIHSILAQTRMVHEIIVWDDGSTDNTEEIAAQLGAIMANAKNTDSVPAFHYYKTENGGKSRALNLALAKAQGDYIWICDDDDLGLPHAMDTLAAVLDKNPHLVAAAGCYRRFTDDPDTNTRLERGPGYWPDLKGGSVLRHLLEDIFIFQNATVVRKEALDAVGPFREDLDRSIDYDMVVRLACHGLIKVIEEPVFLQRKHPGDRGPAKSRRKAKTADQVWKNRDKEVFESFRSRIPLSVYEGMFRADDPKVARRAALLQRACVYARRTDWETAVRDFTDAAKLSPGTRLSPLEKAICKRAFAGKHGSEEAFNREIRSALREVANMSAAGGSITRALVRGVAWRGKYALRHAHLADVAAVGTFAASLLMVSGGGHGRGERPGPVYENDVLPQQTFRVI